MALLGDISDCEVYSSSMYGEAAQYDTTLLTGAHYPPTLLDSALATAPTNCKAIHSHVPSLSHTLTLRPVSHFLLELNMSHAILYPGPVPFIHSIMNLPLSTSCFLAL